MNEEAETKSEVLRRMLEEGECGGISEYSLDSFITELDIEFKLLTHLNSSS